MGILRKLTLFLLFAMQTFAADSLCPVVQLSAASTNHTELETLAAQIVKFYTNSHLLSGCSQLTNLWSTTGVYRIDWHLTFITNEIGSNAMNYVWNNCVGYNLNKQGTRSIVGGFTLSKHYCPRVGTNPPPWGPCNAIPSAGYVSTNR